MTKKFMNNNRLKLIIGLISLGWIALIVSLYYILHKPFTPAIVLSIIKYLITISADLVFLSISGGLGVLLLPDIKITPLSRWSLQTALGLGIASLGILLVGSFLGISTIFGWTVSVVVFLLLRRTILVWWVEVKELIEVTRINGRLGKYIFWGLLILAFEGFLQSLAPPIKFDALVYHIAIPKMYIEAGRIVFIPRFMFWGMPQSGEMLFTWAMSLAGTEAAGVLGWMFALLAILGLIGYGNDRLGHHAGWVSCAALLAGYTLSSSISVAYVDWLALLYGLGFVISLDLWRRNHETRGLILAGAFTGLAIGTKYTAGVLLLAGIGVIIWEFRSRIRGVLRGLLVYLLVVGIISAPWWVKNALSTGNPVYPFFFPTEGMDMFRLSMYSLPPWGNWIEAILLPWRATVNGVEGAPGYSTSIGPLLLALGPLALINWKNYSRKQRQILSTAGIISIIGLMVWAVASRFSGFLIQSRLYFGLFPALALLSGGGYLALREIHWPGLRFGRIAGSLILIVFIFSVVQVSLNVIESGSIEYLLGLSSQEEYLDRNLGWFAPAMRAIEKLPEDSRVIMLWEPRSFYCLPRCSPDEILDRWLYMRNQIPDPADILARWRSEKYTHLLVYQLGVDFVKEDDSRYRDEDWQAFTELLSSLPKVDQFGSAYALYSLTP